MNQKEWEAAAQWYQRRAETRRAQEAPRRGTWWVVVGATLLSVALCELGYEMLQFNPWQAGVFLGLVLAMTGAWMITSWFEGRRSGAQEHELSKR